MDRVRPINWDTMVLVGARTVVVAEENGRYELMIAAIQSLRQILRHRDERLLDEEEQDGD